MCNRIMARLVVNKTKIVLFTFPGPSNMMNTATKVLKCMNIAKASGKYKARASLYSITVYSNWFTIQVA